jgi:ubiquinone/menaquinone biosynthesis C-methylase UbiE
MAFGRSILLHMFGRPTGLLGRLGGVIMARSNRAAAGRVIDALDILPSDHVLEIGFGPGVAIELLAERVTSGRIDGIDPSAEMVAQASARNADSASAGRVALRQGFADRLPYASAIFDKVLAINSVQVWPDAAAGLREVRRVLRPGGRVALGFTPYAAQSNDAVIGAVMAAGFGTPRVVEIEDTVCVLASTA